MTVGDAGPLKVLSIVGAGRSGTTILASILAEVPGFASAGEIRWLWRRGVMDERPCECGLAPSECPVWSPVVTQTLASVDEADPGKALEEIVSAQDEIGATARRLRLLRSASATSTSSWPALALVRSTYEVALRAFAASTGARVVVDTSKRPQDAAVVAAIPGICHYVLHLVRDPRAVAYSWRRRKTFTVGGATHAMGTRRLSSSAARWTSNCWGAELLRRQVPDVPWLRLRYEDFCTEPLGAYRAIMELVGEEGASPFRGPQEVRLGRGHIVAGNPSRFTVGAVRIRADEEWRTGMSRRDQLLIGSTTYPLRRRYGYT